MRWRAEVLEKAKHWYRKNPQKVANGDLVREYGITLEQYENLLHSQNKVCAICSKPETAKNRKRLAVDHSHSNGTIRGLLCGRCNTMIGLAQENVEILNSAIKYLNK